MTLRLKPKVIGLYSPQPQMGKSTTVGLLSQWFSDIELCNVKLSWSLKAPLEYLLYLSEEQIAGSDKDLPFSQLSLSSQTKQILESGCLVEEDKQAFITAFSKKYANRHIAEALVNELEAILASTQIMEQTPRALQIAFYLNLEQVYGSDWLCQLAQIHISQLNRKGVIAVVDDVRTEADYDMLTSLEGAEVWYLERLMPKEGICGGSLEGRLNDQYFDLKVKAASVDDLAQQLKKYLKAEPMADSKSTWSFTEAQFAY